MPPKKKADQAKGAEKFPFPPNLEPTAMPDEFLALKPLLNKNLRIETTLGGVVIGRFVMVDGNPFQIFMRPAFEFRADCPPQSATTCRYIATLCVLLSQCKKVEVWDGPKLTSTSTTLPDTPPLNSLEAQLLALALTSDPENVEGDLLRQTLPDVTEWVVSEDLLV